MPRNTITIPSARSLSEKMRRAGVKVKHLKAKKNNPTDWGKNQNGAYTSNGSNNQAYDPQTKQFTKASSSTRNGLLSVEGSNNTKSAKTWTMSDYDDNGNKVRQSGRSSTSNRNQRAYDVKKGFNKMTETVARAMLEAGQMTQAEYDAMNGGRGGGRYGSLGLTVG